GPAAAGPRAAPARPSPAELRRRAIPHLDRADAAGHRALAEHLRPLDDFFAAARRRVPRFAERALSLDSKLALAADQLPWAAGDRHREFLDGAFRATLFAPEELEALAGRVVREYLAALEE